MERWLGDESYDTPGLVSRMLLVDESDSGTLSLPSSLDDSVLFEFEPASALVRSPGKTNTAQRLDRLQDQVQVRHQIVL